MAEPFSCHFVCAVSLPPLDSHFISKEFALIAAITFLEFVPPLRTFSPLNSIDNARELPRLGEGDAGFYTLVRRDNYETVCNLQ